MKKAITLIASLLAAIFAMFSFVIMMGQMFNMNKSITMGLAIIVGLAVFAGIRDIVGGRSSSYEEVLLEGKETSLREMQERAAQMGANAIVGIDLDYETIGGNGSMLMVAASGTAVVIE